MAISTNADMYSLEDAGVLVVENFAAAVERRGALEAAKKNQVRVGK